MNYCTFDEVHDFLNAGQGAHRLHSFPAPGRTGDWNGQEEKSEALSSCNRGQGISPRARRRAPCGTDRGREKEEAGEAQTYLGQAAGGRMRSTDHLTTLFFETPDAHYKDTRPQFYREYFDKLRALPGVQSAGGV